MAVFKIKEKKKAPKNLKKIFGIVLVSLSCVFMFCLITSLLGFMNEFLLGTFGLFAYPLSFLMFLTGVALLNNKSYTFSKKYTAFLILSIIFLLCVIQMGIIGGKGEGANTLTFGEHLVQSYNQKITAGGILIGLLTTSLTYLTGYVWAYVIFGVLFAIFLALYVDCLVFTIKQKRLGKPVKISLKELKKTENKEVNVVQKANSLEKQKRELEAKEKLGLCGKNPRDFEIRVEKESEKDPSILTPPEIDFNKLFGLRTVKEETVIPSNVEVDVNFQKLRESNLSINQVNQNIHNFAKEETQRGSLSETTNEQVVDQIDSIIQDVVSQNVENFEPKPNQQEPSFSRDNSFSRDRGFENQSRRGLEQVANNDEYLKNIETVKTVAYIKPPIDLITTKSTDMSQFDTGVAKKSMILENTLENFGVEAKVQDVVIGPAVTRYELKMPASVSVRKISNLSSDIALTLEASGGDVRIEAPVPGRNVVGIEVPNEQIAMVSLKDVLTSPKFVNSKSPLTFAVGKDITGEVLTGNLNEMPHLLVAGTTGSGKSVMLNSIILSFIYKASPEDVKLILVDPKMVEFSIYEGIPHLLTPKILTDVDKASNALLWAVEEMERRYLLFRNAGIRNINEYNFSADVVNKKKKKMPFIVIIIDEFSDFMMSSKKDVEERIIKLGQKSRACGIHMILATQRPTVESVTGGIKANFPARVAFKVAGRVNSDVILGNTGAEKLMGRGDMLYAPPEFSSNPKRVQGCFVSTQEVNDIVNYLTLNNEPEIDMDIVNAINNVQKTNSMADEKSMDPLLPQALKICIDSGQASISMLQRRLSLGFSRAGKIIDQMTMFGYVSEPDGARTRKVYIELEEFYQIFGEDI